VLEVWTSCSYESATAVSPEASNSRVDDHSPILYGSFYSLILAFGFHPSLSTEMRARLFYTHTIQSDYIRGFGFMTGFIGPFDTERDYTLQVTVTHRLVFSVCYSRQ
jgi:hypothetical protein